MENKNQNWWPEVKETFYALVMYLMISVVIGTHLWLWGYTTGLKDQPVGSTRPAKLEQMNSDWKLENGTWVKVR